MFIIQIPYLNLDQCYNSGQVFRWIKLRDGKYVIPHGDSALKIEQVKREDRYSDRFVLSCTDQEFYDKWYDYFDIQTDYMSLNMRIRQMDEEFKPKANRANGIRILRQDLFEVIVSFMLATATNIPNIKRMLEQIAVKCGRQHKNSMREVGVVKWYEFPTYEMILDKQKRLDDTFGLKRKENIISLCKDMDMGWIDLDELYDMEYSEAKEFLMCINGIGNKVADCICLYGLHKMESFPIDTHIDKVITRDFGLDTYEEFDEWYLQDLSDCKGLVQQYMFYNDICLPKDLRR